MPRLVSVVTAVPEHRVGAEEMREYLSQYLEAGLAERCARMVASSRIGKRHVSMPVESLMRRRSLGERSEDYCREAVRLAEAVVLRARAAGAEDCGPLEAIVPLSCTGYVMPSLDAHLINRLRLNPSARRIPITDLGCSAGVAGLALAGSLLEGRASATALVFSVELCSICFQQEAPSGSDLLGRLIFGDGAAAVMVHSGLDGPGMAVLAARSCLVPDSLDLLTTGLTDSGFRLGLSSELPKVLRRNLRPIVDQFLDDAGVRLDDIRFFAVHTGGPKILEAVQDSLDLPAGFLESSWEVLEEFGNMSSATVFFVLQKILASNACGEHDLGLLLAFGPGVSCEIVLVRRGGGVACEGPIVLPDLGRAS